MTTPSDSIQPTISMVITVYNTARFLRDALESIRRQAFTSQPHLKVNPFILIKGTSYLSKP